MISGILILLAGLFIFMIVALFKAGSKFQKHVGGGTIIAKIIGPMILFLGAASIFCIIGAVGFLMEL